MGFLSFTTTSFLRFLLWAPLISSRIMRFNRLRSTARLANFLATAMPKSGLDSETEDAKYKPQYKVVLGRIFSNSEILALFNC